MIKAWETIIEPILEMLFWIIIILSIVTPNAYDVWLR